MSDELSLELFQKLQIQKIILRKRFFSYDSFHGSGVFADGIIGIKLVADLGVVFTGHAFSDCGLHESGKRGEDVDGRVDLFIVHLAVDENLAFRDVAGQVGDRVRDVVVGHRQNGQLGDGTVFALHSACSFVNCR